MAAHGRPAAGAAALGAARGCGAGRRRALPAPNARHSLPRAPCLAHAPHRARPAPRAPPPLRAPVFVDYFGVSALMPLLPFYLEDHAGLTGDELALWVGLISTAPFAAIAVSWCAAQRCSVPPRRRAAATAVTRGVARSIFWGRASDFIGAKRAVQITLAGDALTFAATGFVVRPGAILAVRFAAGLSSPIVPALAYVFEVLPPSEAMHGITCFVTCVTLGFLVGGSAAALYAPIGWRGVALVTAGLAVLGLALSSFTMVRAPVAPCIRRRGVGAARVARGRSIGPSRAGANQRAWARRCARRCSSSSLPYLSARRDLPRSPAPRSLEISRAEISRAETLGQSWRVLLRATRSPRLSRC